MKVRKIIAALAIFMFTINSNVLATTITGVEGINGIYDIIPTLKKGKVGFRQYNKFELSDGDTANLIYDKDGKAINTFVNMVDGKVNIGGILRAVGADGNLNNGKAVFISPNGMVIGSSGVVRVGSLSVYTPGENQYNKYKSNPDAVFSKVDNNNADISIYGSIIAKDAVTLSGKNVRMGSGSAIYAGVNDTTSSNADLFNMLVSSGVKENNSFASQNGKVYIKTASNETELPSGQNSGTYFNGIIKNFASNGSVSISTNNEAGAFIGGTINSAKDITIKNTKGSLTFVSSSNLDNNGNLTISNSGQGGLMFGGNITNNNTSDTKNSIQITSTQGDLHLFGDINTKNTNIKISANDGSLHYLGKINNTGKLTMTHSGSGDMNLSNMGYIVDSGSAVYKENISKISNHGATTITNYSGDMNFDVDTENHGTTTIKNYGNNMNFGGGQTITYGTTNIINNGTGDLEFNNRDFQGGSVNVSNNQNSGALKINEEAYFVDNDKLKITNNSQNGMDFNGHIVNSNDTDNKFNVTINNNNGDLNLNGIIDTITTDIDINSKGNLNFGGEINNSGKLKISHSGTGNMNLYGKYNRGYGSEEIIKEKESKISNLGTTTIKNSSGDLNIDGYLENRGGKMHIINNGNKLAIGGNVNHNKIDNNGELNITNNGNDGMLIDWVDINGGKVNITNNEGAVVIKDNSNFNDNTNLKVVNNGQNADFDGLHFQCNVKNNNTSDKTRNVTIKNNKGYLHLASDFDTKNTNIDISNNGNEGFFYIGRINNTGNLSMKNNGNGDFILFGVNHYTGNPALVFSKIQNSGNTTISNSGGNMHVYTDIENSNGMLNITNKGDAMYIGGESYNHLNIRNNGGINIKNDGRGGITIAHTAISATKGKINITNKYNQMNMGYVNITNTDKGVNITNRGHLGMNMYHPNINAKGNVRIYNHSDIPADIVTQSNSDVPIQSTNGNVIMQNINPETGARTNILIRSEEQPELN